LNTSDLNYFSELSEEQIQRGLASGNEKLYSFLKNYDSFFKNIDVLNTIEEKNIKSRYSDLLNRLNIKYKQNILIHIRF